MFRRRHPGLNREVLISLFSGNAVSGVLVRVSGPWLTLRNAKIHEPGATPAPADGKVLIHEANVDFTQIPDGS